MKCVVSIVTLIAACEDRQSMTAKPELNETDLHILDAIRKWVRSGFYTSDEVDYMIDDILEDDAHEDYLRNVVGLEFAKKRKDEKTWPKQTDCDRLDSVFAALEKRNILCLQNVGYEMSDGHHEAFEVLSDQPGHSYTGYCFYHGQDLERAVDGGGLMIAFDHVDADAPDKIKIGHALKEELERAGFQIDRGGTPGKRINVPKIEWKRRYRKGEGVATNRLPVATRTLNDNLNHQPRIEGALSAAGGWPLTLIWPLNRTVKWISLPFWASVAIQVFALRSILSRRSFGGMASP